MSEILVQVEDLHKKFGDFQALDGVSFTLNRGEVLSVIGPSGSGKSTLLRCITQLETFDSGTISIGGLSIIPSTNSKKSSTNSINKQILLKTGLVFQNFNLFPHFSVLRNITEAQVHVLGRSKADAEANARDLLTKMGLGDKADSYPCQLSGGQQQRVSIARALALSPEVLLFDEPTSALDPELTGEILAVMKGLAAVHMTMIVVTHEMKFAHDVSDKVIFLDGGKILAQGTPAEVLEHSSAPRIQRFLSRLQS